jgi:tetratricopeptide (TPR) repeat protein
MHGWINETRKLFYRAMQNFMKGMPGRSIELAGKALSIAQKDGLDWGLIKAYNAIASAYLSLGETRKAAAAIERLIAYSKKLKRAETAMEILLSKDSLPPLRLSKDTLPTTRLAVLLKRGQYRKAYRLAQQKGIMAYLHRFIFYAPEGVHRSIQTGKSTGLPRGILQLPVFNKAMPVYSIRFLGRLVVHKDRRYVKQRLGPKDRALLIHFALRIGEPGMSVSVHRVCHNFWEHRKDPIQNLSHAILRLKKALKIPSHFLVIQQVRGESVVINRGFYCMTDYAELEQKYTTAHAFERVGEYGFARDDYLTALQLVRGRFFHRMYDTWSEDVRGAIANKIENTVGRLNEIHRDQAPDPTIERISDRMRRVLGY